MKVFRVGLISTLATSVGICAPLSPARRVQPILYSLKNQVLLRKVTEQQSFSFEICKTTSPLESESHPSRCVPVLWSSIPNKKQNMFLKAFRKQLAQNTQELRQYRNTGYLNSGLSIFQSFVSGYVAIATRKPQVHFFYASGPQMAIRMSRIVPVLFGIVTVVNAWIALSTLQSFSRNVALPIRDLDRIGAYLFPREPIIHVQYASELTMEQVVRALRQAEELVEANNTNLLRSST